MKIPLALRPCKLALACAILALPADGLVAQVADSAQQTVTLPTSTRITVAINDSLNSTSAQSGHEFGLVLTEPVSDAWGTVVLPSGTPAVGRVLNATTAGWIAREANVLFTLRGIEIGGRNYPVRTNSMNIEGGREGWLTPLDVSIRSGRTFLFTLVAPVTLPVAPSTP